MTPGNSITVRHLIATTTISRRTLNRGRGSLIGENSKFQCVFDHTAKI